MSGNRNDDYDEDVETYYHYTDKKGALGIKKSETILASAREGKKDDARFGDGAYFTQMDPQTFSKEEIAANNYDGTSRTIQAALDQGKVDYVVKVDVPVDEAPVDVEHPKRDIHLHEDDDFDLSQYDYTISKVKK